MSLSSVDLASRRSRKNLRTWSCLTRQAAALQLRSFHFGFAAKQATYDKMLKEIPKVLSIAEGVSNHMTNE